MDTALSPLRKHAPASDHKAGYARPNAKSAPSPRASLGCRQLSVYLPCQFIVELFANRDIVIFHTFKSRFVNSCKFVSGFTPRLNFAYFTIPAPQRQTAQYGCTGLFVFRVLAMTYFRTGIPHYHRRYVVSRSCSGWEGVGPTRYGRQEFGGSVVHRLPRYNAMA